MCIPVLTLGVCHLPPLRVVAELVGCLYCDVWLCTTVHCVCVCVCVRACVCVLSTKEAKEFQEGSQGWGEHTQEGALLPTASGAQARVYPYMDANREA